MKLLSILTVTLLFLFSSTVFALERKTFCVWDPVGRTGPVVNFYSDVIPKAQNWGLDIRFVAYTDERVAAKKFKEGHCEAVVLTSILSRQFIKFAGTMDAIGAINSQKGLELALATLTRERAGNLMIEGDYEVVTTFPVGSMFAFVRDRSVNTIDDFKGKSLAILNGDPQMKKFSDLAGSSQVDVTLASFAGLFNRGEVDIVIMPALAYNTFELYEGLGKKGGIIDYRLYYGMLQTIAKRDQFPDDFGRNMRSYMLTRLKAMNKMVKDAEEEIPPRYWIKTSQFVKDDIDHFSKRVRLELKDDNVNHPTALKLFWKIRCRLDPSRGECKESPDKKDKREKQNAEKKKAQKKLKQLKLQRQKQKKLAQEKLDSEKLTQQNLAQERLALKKKDQLLQAKLDQERFDLAKLEREKQELEQGKLELKEEKIKLEQEKLELQEQKQEKEQEKNERSWWQYILFWL